MECVIVKPNDVARFDELVHTGLPEGRNIEMASKMGATVNGEPAIVVSFTVQLPDGSTARAQAATTLKAFKAGVDTLAGYHEREDAHRN